MSVIKDLEKGISKNAMSLTYILLLANILGLTVFLQGSKEDYSLNEKQDEENLKVNLKRSKVEDEIKEKKGKIKTEVNKKAIKEYAEGRNHDLNGENGVAAVKQFKKDNVVDLREIAELRKASSEKSNKPLVWRFPK